MSRSEPPLDVPLPRAVTLAADRPLPRLDVSAQHASATVFFHGAHLAAWQPAHSAAPVLWLSRRSFFEQDKPIRGGVPVCFPWFGPHPADSDAPAHGFARLADWTLTGATEAADGTVDLAFSLEHDAATSPAWPHRCRITHRISIGSTLTMTLDVLNTGIEPFTFEEALHTYLAIGDIEAVTIRGLEGAEYVDKVAGFLRRRQLHEPIRFTGETDRIYVDTTAPCTIHDPSMGRRIAILKSGSASTVVWNPWTARARSMPDFGDDEWRGMVCVETANVGTAAVKLAPGGAHRMTATIEVERM